MHTLGLQGHEKIGLRYFLKYLPWVIKVLTHEFDPHAHGLDALEGEEPTNLAQGVWIPADGIPPKVTVLPKAVVVTKQLMVYMPIRKVCI